MKKLLILLGLVVVLAACGNDTQADNETNNQEMNNESSDEIEENAMENESNELDELYSDVEVETEGDMLSVTDDPLVAGDINDGHIVFEDDFDYTYLIKDRYTNDETDEDGFNHMSFDGYDVKYAVALLETTDEKDVIGFFVETDNGTDTTVQYNMDMAIQTNDEEVGTDDMYGIGESKPGNKLKGFVFASFDYDISDEIEITFEQPWDDEGEFNEPIGDEVKITLSK